MVFKKGDNADNYNHWLIDKFDKKRKQYTFETTAETYRYAVKKFCKFLDSHENLEENNKVLEWAFDQNELTKKQKSHITDLLLEYQQFLEDEGQSPNSQTQKLRGVVSFFKRYRIEAFYDDLKFKRVDKTTKHGMNILTPEQMRDFHKLHSGFNQVALEIRISTMCRIGVFSELRFCDVIEYYDDCMKIRFYPDPNNLDHEFTKDNYIKTGNDEYYGFLTPEASRSFRKYKAQIIEEYGKHFDEKMLVYQPKKKFRPVLIENTQKSANARRMCDHRGDYCNCELVDSTQINIRQTLVNYGTNKLKELANVTTLSKSKVGKSGDRFDISSTHHTRKYGNTILKDVDTVDSDIVEHWVMNHKTGLDDSYRIIKEPRFFEEYKKMIPYLTINEIEAVEMADRFQAQKNLKDLEKMQIEIQNLDDKLEQEKHRNDQLVNLYASGISFEQACKKLGFKATDYNN